MTFKKRSQFKRKRLHVPSLIKIKSATGNWQFTNIGGNRAAPATTSLNSVQFGFPRITQVVYPG